VIDERTSRTSAHTEHSEELIDLSQSEWSVEELQAIKRESEDPLHSPHAHHILDDEDDDESSNNSHHSSDPESSHHVDDDVEEDEEELEEEAAEEEGFDINTEVVDVEDVDSFSQHHF
jgi:hypothetical protein